MENETLLPEEEVSILTLTDENGQDVNFEYLDCIEYEGVEYLVLMPEDEEDDSVVILEVEPVDEEVENYLAVEDEAVLNAVFAIFKEKFKDVIEFEDGCKIPGCFRSRGFYWQGRFTNRPCIFVLISSPWQRHAFYRLL